MLLEIGSCEFSPGPVFGDLLFHLGPAENEGLGALRVRRREQE